MATSQTMHGVVTALFLAVLFGGGVSQPALDLAGGERPQVLDLFLQPPTEANLRAYEKDMEDASQIVRAVRPAMQFAQFMALQDLGKDIQAGREGWFFYKPDLRFLIEPWGGREAVLSAIRVFHDDLAARGIRLLVLPAPGKPSIYPDMVTARAGAAGAPHARDTIARLREMGIDTADLFELFASHRARTALYLRQDTHWSPEGMQLAAHHVAGELLRRGWVDKGAARHRLETVELARHGDVLRMARSPQLLAAHPPETMRCARVVDAGTGEAVQDAPDSEVLVLGDSFLRIYERDEPGSAGFSAHLAHALGRPVASIINDGGASTLVRQELNRKPELLRNKKVVVWEFVERDLRFGMEGWQKVPLPG